MAILKIRDGSVYVAGRVTNGTDVPDPAMVAAMLAAASKLIMQGYDVVIHTTVVCYDWSWQDYMTYFLTIVIPMCSEVHMVHTWTGSKGARIEHEHALKLGKRITYEEGGE